MIKNNQVLIRNEEEENKQVRKDLMFVLLVNGLMLAGLLVLFFLNRSSGVVDKFFANLLKF
jgi:hypothetical protein